MKRIIIGVVLLLTIIVAVVFIRPYYEQRKYTGEQIPVPSGLSTVETIELYLEHYGRGESNAVAGFYYVEDVNNPPLPPPLWWVKAVTIESIKDISNEHDFSYSKTGNLNAYEIACVQVNYTIDYYFQDSETWEKYSFFLVRESADSDWKISDQGPNV